MCGRFTLTTDDYESVARALEAAVPPGFATHVRPRFNIAPSDPHWIVCRHESRRELVPATWGMPGPSGSKPPPGREAGYINARSETAPQKFVFRDAFWSARCGVIADGFYEWSGPPNDRRPHWFHAPPGRILVFGGLFRDVVDPQTGEVERRFTILTTEANPQVAPLHDRMPVILPLEALDVWLVDPDDEQRPRLPLEVLQSLMRPAPESTLTVTEVGKRVNSVRNDDPQCIEPVQSPRQQTLF